MFSITSVLTNADFSEDLHDLLPESIRTSDKLMVGTSLTNSPLEFEAINTIKWKGLDIDSTKEIASHYMRGEESQG